MPDADFLSLGEGGEKRMKFKNGTTEMNAEDEWWRGEFIFSPVEKRSFFLFLI